VQQREQQQEGREDLPDGLVQQREQQQQQQQQQQEGREDLPDGLVQQREQQQQHRAGMEGLRQQKQRRQEQRQQQEGREDVWDGHQQELESRRFQQQQWLENKALYHMTLADSGLDVHDDITEAVEGAGSDSQAGAGVQGESNSSSKAGGEAQHEQAVSARQLLNEYKRLHQEHQQLERGGVHELPPRIIEDDAFGTIIQWLYARLKDRAPE
jgi:hypothetical protein